MLSQIDDSPKLYIGLDIHKKSWAVSIRTDLFDHKTFSMPPSSETLYDYVTKHFPNHSVSICYEAGCCGFTAARAFLNFAWDVTVVNPADVPRMNKQNFQKNDKIDSRNLAKQLQNQSLRPIHIPTEVQEQFRSLLRQRNTITKQLRKAKTHIKSMLLFHGIDIPPQFDNANWTIEFKQWIKDLKWSNPCGQISMDSKMKSMEFAYDQYLSIGNELRSYCRKNHKDDYYLLMSIPGIGGFLASAIIAECGDLTRFNNESQLSSFIGVVPGIHNSGSSEIDLGLTPRANKILRPYIIESAWIAI